MASLKPLIKTAAKRVIRPSVIPMFTAVGLKPCSAPCMRGFSTICAVASAAERVMVIMKSVATKPSRIRIKNFPFHHERSAASIEIEPSP